MNYNLTEGYMEISVKGQTMKLPGYISLDDPINQAFADLFIFFFIHQPSSLDDLLSHLPTFECSASQYFDRVANQANHIDLQDRFFSNLTIVSNTLMGRGRFAQAQAFWDRILQSTGDWERCHDSRVHKGSPLYFWAVAAILQGEIDKGFLLMHKAYQEDVETGGTGHARALPAFKFVTLDFDNRDQHFYQYVEHLAHYLEPFIGSYRTTSASQLDLSQFRDLFLAQPPSDQAAFSFTHTVARLAHLERLPSHTLDSDFAGQYELNCLFDLALVIEQAIKYKDPNPDHRYFIDFAEFLSKQSCLGLTRADLSHANKQMITNLDSTMVGLIDRTFSFPNGATHGRLQCDLAIVYCLRNHAAHNVSSFPTMSEKFEDIRQSLFNILFLCVDVLYR